MLGYTSNIITVSDPLQAGKAPQVGQRLRAVRTAARQAGPLGDDRAESGAAAAESHHRPRCKDRDRGKGGKSG